MTIPLAVKPLREMSNFACVLRKSEEFIQVWTDVTVECTNALDDYSEYLFFIIMDVF